MCTCIMYNKYKYKYIKYTTIYALVFLNSSETFRNDFSYPRRYHDMIINVDLLVNTVAYVMKPNGNQCRVFNFIKYCRKIRIFNTAF